jgi:3-deoxy-D-manno-octulosonic-acid transferase
MNTKMRLAMRGKESQMSQLLSGFLSGCISWLLNGVYLFLIIIASPWIAWSAYRHGKYREGFAEKFLGRVPHSSWQGPTIWLHAVSVGEVNLLATMIQDLSTRHPAWRLVISTTTKSGYDLACSKYADYTVFYAPLDFSWAVHAALQRVQPDLLVLAELELWPNWIRAAQKQGARVAIVNGRLSDTSFRGYRRIRPLLAALLRQVDLVAVQNSEVAQRFTYLGTDPTTLHVTGSLKYDGAQSDRNNPKTQELQKLAHYKSSDVVWLAGSTQQPEEKIVLQVFTELVADFSQLRLVLVPRHPERFNEVAQLLKESGLPWCRRSELRCSSVSTDGQSPYSVVLVDTIGELGAWWGTAHIGFVGGTFGSRGGQNMIEPTAYGVATSFGPNTRNFRDIVAQLLAANAAEVLDDPAALSTFVRRALEDAPWAHQLGNRARQFVATQQGATLRTVELLESLLEVASDDGKSSFAA